MGEIVYERQMAGEAGCAGDDHLSVLIRTEIEGERLGIASIVAAIYTMLVTGAEVVPLSVANTAYYLAELPDQRARIVADPTLIPHAFAESLRYDQPTNLLGRTVRDPVEIRGKRLEPGSGVMFLWASGNRDEAEFEHADVFDVALIATGGQKGAQLVELSVVYVERSRLDVMSTEASCEWPEPQRKRNDFFEPSSTFACIRSASWCCSSLIVNVCVTLLPTWAPITTASPNSVSSLSCAAVLFSDVPVGVARIAARKWSVSCAAAPPPAV